MPLDLAPSQWEPLIPELSERCCTIALGGPLVGAVSLLEGRGRSGYLSVVRTVLDLTDIKPGEVVHQPDERPIAQPWSCNSSPLAWSPLARSTRSFKMIKPGAPPANSAPTTTRVCSLIAMRAPGTPSANSVNGLVPSSASASTRMAR